jgi:hypothetical protein
MAIDEVRTHAHSPADLEILSRFLDLQLLDGHSELALDPPRRLLRLLLRAMKLLHLCNFHHEDVCCILAHTSLCFRSTYRACGHQMDSQEVSNAVVAQMFIAHSYIQDEICPLWAWHEHIFRNYCSMKTLNEVILKLLAIRAYSLRVDRKEMMKRYEHLCGSCGRMSSSSSPEDEQWSPVQERETGPVTEADTTFRHICSVVFCNSRNLG